MDTERNNSLSALRVCVILLVLVHHSILAYCRLGHFDPQHYLWSSAPIVDPQRWIGFDVIEDFNDAYFMSLMFLISGLFVLPSLHCKGALAYATGRCLRLGVPFVVCVTIIMPIAYYPSYRQTGHAISFGAFWLDVFRRYGWPGGPAWFIWLLLALDLFFTALTQVWPTLQTRLTALPNQIVSRPGTSLAVITAMAMAAFLPADWLFGPSPWFRWGPFAVQKSRVMLYALFFAVGVAAGSAGSHHQLLAPDGPVGQHWVLRLRVHCLRSLCRLSDTRPASSRT